MLRVINADPKKQTNSGLMTHFQPSLQSFHDDRVTDVSRASSVGPAHEEADDPPRRKGWYNRRGDQLWTNKGDYKPASSGQEYPPDLADYPNHGEGWMNEEGLRIDMQHRHIPKRRDGWYNRSGDQLWSNKGDYKPSSPGQEYPQDLADYPNHGEGWMNEEGLRIDMQHQLIPNTSRASREMSDGDTNPMHKRRKGWYNRRGDQLWTNKGAYKSPPTGQEYSPDLANYPDHGEGWMNEEGVRIDMQHRRIHRSLLRKRPHQRPEE